MKQYNNEKAIISLTSWKARINTVAKTIYSLLQQCPNFHIVLVLSEEEFPQKENELPDNLMIFVNNNLIELLWVYNNYKSYKKVLFTLDKYRDVPVISADDDCIYTRNYADELYSEWLKNQTYVIRYVPYTHNKKHKVAGWCTLYPPYNLSNFAKIAKERLMQLKPAVINMSMDDDFYNLIINHNEINSMSLNKTMYAIFHDDVMPLHSSCFQHTYGKKYKK